MADPGAYALRSEIVPRRRSGNPSPKRTRATAALAAEANLFPLSLFQPTRDYTTYLTD
jgi:hypothetical protein